MKLKITVTDEHGVQLDEFWTDEDLVDVSDAINQRLSVWATEEELDEANQEEDDEDG